MLGRENISNAFVALGELVKNGYDADASEVVIHFDEDERGKQRITLKDNGSGMGYKELKENWLLIGTDTKEKNPLTDKRRIKVGKKGIGRLALDKLSKKVLIETYKERESYGLRLFVDWSKYEKTTSSFSDVKHPLVTTLPGNMGTTLTLTDLHDTWDKEDFLKLRKDLALLIPPMEKIHDFSINVIIKGYPELSGAIESQFSSLAEFSLESKMDENGEIQHLLTHRDGTSIVTQKKWSEVIDGNNNDPKPQCGQVLFRLQFYNRNPTDIKNFDVKISDINKLLDSFQGIRIYRDSFRVKPYGDPDGSHDWLGLNARRTKSPEAVGGRPGYWRVAENQVVGAVYISRNTNPNLEDQTNREGLIENQSYYDLRTFALDAVSFFETERQRKEKEKPRDRPEEIQQRLTEKEKELKEKAKTSRKRKQTAQAKAYSQAARAVKESKEYVEEVQSENLLLMGLATLGIAMASFGHETAEAINNIRNRVEPLNDLADDIPPHKKMDYVDDIEAINKSIEEIRTWGSFALEHVKREKRVKTLLDVNATIKETNDCYRRSFTKMGIELNECFDLALPKIKLFPMDIEAIIINFTTNAIEALKFTPKGKRKIEIHTSMDSTSCYIEYSDSGKGFSDDDKKRVFVSMYTTKVDVNGRNIGTGLGLTIVKRIVEDNGGTIDAIGHCDTGGACFVIKLPLNGKGG